MVSDLTCVKVGRHVSFTVNLATDAVLWIMIRLVLLTTIFAEICIQEILLAFRIQLLKGKCTFKQYSVLYLYGFTDCLKLDLELNSRNIQVKTVFWH